MNSFFSFVGARFPRAVTLFAVTVTLFTLTACTREPDAIKLGHYGSLTGKDAAFGVATRKGVLLAIEEINAKGGVLGRPLAYLVEDIQSKQGESATAVKKTHLPRQSRRRHRRQCLR